MLCAASLATPCLGLPRKGSDSARALSLLSTLRRGSIPTQSERGELDGQEGLRVLPPSILLHLHPFLLSPFEGSWDVFW